MIVEVTQEDIAAGERGSGACCPIALALARVAEADVFVYGETWTWWIGVLKNERIPLPLKAQRFLDAFDDGKPVQPFTFRTRRPA